MYAISKLTPRTRAFVSDTLNSVINTKPYFNVAVAYVYAQNLTIPSQPVEDALAYYKLNHQQTVLSLMSQLNEIIPFDTRAAREIAQAFYAYRVSAVYPPKIPLAMSEDKAVAEFFGLTRNFSPEVLKVISENGKEICHTVNRITDLVGELAAAEARRNLKLGEGSEEEGHHVY